MLPTGLFSSSFAHFPFSALPSFPLFGFRYLICQTAPPFCSRKHAMSLSICLFCLSFFHSFISRKGIITVRDMRTTRLFGPLSCVTLFHLFFCHQQTFFHTHRHATPCLRFLKKKSLFITVVFVLVVDVDVLVLSLTNSNRFSFRQSW